MWTAETGGDMDALLDRLGRKMPDRILSIEFAQSRQYAVGQYLFVKLFGEQLAHPQHLAPAAPTPYIVIEGISGSGKQRNWSYCATTTWRSVPRQYRSMNHRIGIAK